MKEAVDDLNTMLEEAASEFGIVSGMVDTISKAILKVRCCITFKSSFTLSLSVIWCQVWSTLYQLKCTVPWNQNIAYIYM